MLTGTSHAADEMVGKTRPTIGMEFWHYDVEKVAINAVLAGAEPKHLPVLLALSAVLAANQLPSGTPRERQALHAFEEWQATHPENPESAAVAERAAELRERLVRERYERWLRGARESAEHGELGGRGGPGGARRADAPGRPRR